MRAIEDQWDPGFLGDGFQRVHLGRMAVEVGGGDRCRPVDDATHILGVEGCPAALDVGEPRWPGDDPEAAAIAFLRQHLPQEPVA